MATRLLTRTLSSPKKLSRLSSQASLPVFKKKLVVVSYFGELLLWTSLVSYFGELLLWTTLASYFRELLWWATFVNYFGELVSWTTFVNYFGELLWQKDCASNKEDFKSSLIWNIQKQRQTWLIYAAIFGVVQDTFKPEVGLFKVLNKIPRSSAETNLHSSFQISLGPANWN